MFGIIRLANGYDEDDLATMETAIEGVTGIDTCELVVSGIIPTANDIPAGFEVHATIEGRFILQEIAE